MQDFRNLTVWHKAHALTLAIYRATQRFPRDEQYGLTSQLRRAAVSIGANLAEGCGRSGDAELRRFADIAMGSASETEYLLLVARDLTLLSEVEFDELVKLTLELKRMLAALIVKLRAARTN